MPAPRRPAALLVVMVTSLSSPLVRHPSWSWSWSLSWSSLGLSVVSSWKNESFQKKLPQTISRSKGISKVSYIVIYTPLSVSFSHNTSIHADPVCSLCRQPSSRKPALVLVSVLLSGEMENLTLTVGQCRRALDGVYARLMVQ